MPAKIVSVLSVSVQSFSTERILLLTHFAVRVISSVTEYPMKDHFSSPTYQPRKT